MSRPWFYLCFRAALVVAIFALLRFHTIQTAIAEVACVILFVLLPWNPGTAFLSHPYAQPLVFHVYDGGVSRKFSRSMTRGVRPSAGPGLRLVAAHGRRVV